MSDDVETAKRLAALTVELRDLQEKVHRSNNILQILMCDVTELRHEFNVARSYFDKAIALVEARVARMRERQVDHDNPEPTATKDPSDG